MTPALQSIWFVEDVIADESTNKVTLTGLFNVIDIPTGAESYDTPWILFFAVSGVRGRLQMRLVFVDLATLEVLLDRPVIVETDDPFEINDMWVRVNTLPTPRAGAYAWELHWNGNTVGSSRLTIREGEP